MTQWILTSSVLILLVIAVRGLFKEKMKAKYTYALWLLVLVRLLCPVNFGELSFNLLTLAEEGKERMEEREAPAQETDVDAAWEEQKAFYESHGIMYVDPDNPTKIVRYPVDSNDLAESYLPVGDAAMVETEENGFTFPEINWQRVLPFAWIAGMAVMVAVIFSVNISFSTTLGLFRKELPVLAKKGRGKQELAVYLADGIYSSCLYGVVHPSIYLNKEGMGDQEKNYCVEHEYSHYLQGDMVWSLCRTVCLILHWYNPLVWLAVLLSKKDAELACDERTIERLGEEERYSYGHTLVGLAAGQSKAVQMFGMATLMASDKKEVVDRVKAISTKKETKIITGLLVALLVVGIGFFVFTGEAKGEQENNNGVATVTEMPEEESTKEAEAATQEMETRAVEMEFPTVGVATDSIELRPAPGYEYEKRNYVKNETPVTILAAEQDKDGNLWYYVGYSWGDGYTAHGYADSNYIIVGEEDKVSADVFRLYKNKEVNGEYTELINAEHTLTGIVYGGEGWFYTETWDKQSGWILYGSSDTVDRFVEKLLKIAGDEWVVAKEQKELELVLSVKEVSYKELSFVDHVALEMVNGEGWSVDLNGDGVKENLYIDLNGVFINGERAFTTSDARDEYWLLDIDTTDSFYELLNGNGDLYIYDGTGLQAVKGIEEMYFAEDNGVEETLERYLGALDSFVRMDEHTISFEDYHSDWGGFAVASYCLDEKHDLCRREQISEVWGR